MLTEVAFLSLPRRELLDLHRALLARHLIEVTLRREQGLEPIGYPLLLERIDRLLGMTEEEAHRLFHHIEDELWEYSWTSYTEEWAWCRAQQDVAKKTRGKKMKQEEIEELVEKQLEEKFEDYVEEIDMNEMDGPKKREHGKKKAIVPKKEG